MNIIIHSGNKSWNAVTYDSPTGKKIIEALPLKSKVQTWRDEIYFYIPVNAHLEDYAKEEVEIGDLAYWPQALFFVYFLEQPRSAREINQELIRR